MGREGARAAAVRVVAAEAAALRVVAAEAAAVRAVGAVGAKRGGGGEEAEMEAKAGTAAGMAA